MLPRRSRSDSCRSIPARVWADIASRLIRFISPGRRANIGQNTRFIELAGEINTSMPMHVINRTAEALNARRKAMNGSRVLVVGLAYKPNVDDERESPSYVLMNLLKERGAEAAYYDPHVPVIRPTREHSHWAGTRSVDLGAVHAGRFRRGHHRDQPSDRQLSGAGRLVAVHRGHPQCHGHGENQTGPDLEGVKPHAQWAAVVENGQEYRERVGKFYNWPINS